MIERIAARPAVEKGLEAPPREDSPEAREKLVEKARGMLA